MNSDMSRRHIDWKADITEGRGDGGEGGVVVIVHLHFSVAVK